MWPAIIVQQLSPKLPPEFTAEPRAHLGSYYEIDVCAYEDDQEGPRVHSSLDASGVATAAWSAPEPTAVAEVDFGEQYEYEVLVYDQSRARTLVAAVEIVSPANKDRPENRRAFLSKCSALVQARVSVSIVDLVTIRQFNLFAELLEQAGWKQPAFGPTPPPIYAATCRSRKVAERPRLEMWAYPLAVGKPLPTLPIWLQEDLAISLDLEASYEETCRALRIS